MKPPGCFLRFTKTDDGVISALSLFLTIIGLMVAGIAVDYANAVRAREQLQANADATAHAALVAREFATSDAAIQTALALAYGTMPKTTYGAIVDASDIVFGTWDSQNHAFTADSTSRSAVKVVMHETTAYANPVATYLLQLVGVTHWDISVSSIFESYYPSCLTEGFVGQVAVDLQSNNSFLNGFCIHSNNAVSLNSNDSFEAGTVVSMPDPATIQLPSSGFSSNPGLQQALQKDSWKIRILDQIDTIASDLAVGDPRYTPSYIANRTPIAYSQNKIGTGDLTSGNIYTASCNGNSPLNISSGTVLSKIVLVTNCLINFGSDVQLQDVTIVSTNTSKGAISGASGLEVGLNDNCAPGGGAQIITDGGMDFPSALNLFGGQLIAKGDVSFSANGNGVQGASIISGGTVSGTSGMTMAYCGTGMEENYQAEYFRMVM